MFLQLLVFVSTVWMCMRIAILRTSSRVFRHVFFLHVIGQFSLTLERSLDLGKNVFENLHCLSCETIATSMLPLSEVIAFEVVFLVWARHIFVVSYRYAT